MAMRRAHICCLGSLPTLNSNLSASMKSQKAIALGQETPRPGSASSELSWAAITIQTTRQPGRADCRASLATSAVVKRELYLVWGVLRIARRVDVLRKVARLLGRP